VQVDLAEEKVKVAVLHGFKAAPVDELEGILVSALPGERERFGPLRLGLAWP
jgi:hypothetical protein